MGFCSRRYLFLSLCMIQMLSVMEKQIFDFLGYLWIPILMNFFEIIFTILGFFGAYQYRPRYIISYIVWHLFWLGWNIFIICLYLDVANLDHKTNKVLKVDVKSESWWNKQGPGCRIILNGSEKAASENCLVNYVYVEIFQAGLQSLTAFFGMIVGVCLSQTFLEEDDTSLRKSSRKNTKRTSLYSIEFNSLELETHDDCDNEIDNNIPQPLPPKPMTPRRVKRRSVMTRGSSGRRSTSSRKHSTSRSSTRSGRRIAKNTGKHILDQQKNELYDGTATPPIESLPHFYNSVSNDHLNWHNHGHSNPTYQQSSIQSLNDPEDLDDLYNNRPASVRSSYSNFHGTRPISYTQSNHQHSHATPQVPQKRNQSNRNSLRSMAFLNNGPPGYSTSVPVDSETAI